jgi:uncharacterized protein
VSPIPKLVDPLVEAWEATLLGWLAAHPSDDPAHDQGHLRRVWTTAARLAAEEAGADPLVVLAASLLHDVVNVAKDSPDRSSASRLAARRADAILRELGFPEGRLDAVVHAIEAHSYSAGIEPASIEARIVRDADRLDALGAIGVARCFAVAGMTRRALADGGDPAAERRPLDDGRYALDHFAVKLLALPETMATAAGRRLAEERARFLAEFRRRMIAELAGAA